MASTKSESVELLPAFAGHGFSGNRVELWRSRIHRSTIEKIHGLWPPRQAALMDAMVIGEDAFINRPTRTEFQRSGTYHVLVVSGMNITILALAKVPVLIVGAALEGIAGTVHRLGGAHVADLRVPHAWSCGDSFVRTVHRVGHGTASPPSPFCGRRLGRAFRQRILDFGSSASSSNSSRSLGDDCD